MSYDVSKQVPNALYYYYYSRNIIIIIIRVFSLYVLYTDAHVLGCCWCIIKVREGSSKEKSVYAYIILYYIVGRCAVRVRPYPLRRVQYVILMHENRLCADGERKKTGRVGAAATAAVTH